VQIHAKRACTATVVLDKTHHTLDPDNLATWINPGGDSRGLRGPKRVAKGGKRRRKQSG
jgi:hypothetical protein